MSTYEIFSHSLNAFCDEIFWFVDFITIIHSKQLHTFFHKLEVMLWDGTRERWMCPCIHCTAKFGPDLSSIWCMIFARWTWINFKMKVWKMQIRVGGWVDKRNELASQIFLSYFCLFLNASQHWTQYQFSSRHHLHQCLLHKQGPKKRGVLKQWVLSY